MHYQFHRMVKILSLLIFLFSLNLLANETYSTQIFDRNIKSLQIDLSEQPYSLPILELDDEEVLLVKFDELSYEEKNYTYRLLHCNADWTISDLQSSEYLDGFTTANIEYAEKSINTNILYTHYEFSFPNDEMKIKASGNYVVQIIEDNKLDNPVAQITFSVVEPKLKLIGKVRPNTDLEINGRLQQLDFDLEFTNYRIDNPDELKILVRQNQRLDNEIYISKPTYINSNSFSYKNNKALIFEGGNEYRRFDFSSYYSANESIDEIKQIDGQKHVFVTIDKPTKGSYMHRPDVNGNFIINFQESFEYGDLEADYAYVHINLKSDIYFDGRLYLGGEFMYEKMDANSVIEYNNENGSYEKTILLKQGGYTYQYRFLPKGSNKATVSRIENSYWQTNNDYQIYVYHRPWGSRADKLIGFSNISSNQ